MSHALHHALLEVIDAMRAVTVPRFGDSIHNANVERARRSLDGAERLVVASARQHRIRLKGERG